jgi:hypothetical protein
MKAVLHYCIYIYAISPLMQENILQFAKITLAKFISAVIMGADSWRGAAA